MDSIKFEVQEHVAKVVLNRPDVMNAFNYDMLLELEEVVESIRINEDVRLVTITGAGAKAFSVGADLKERKTLTPQQVKRNIFKIGEVFSKIEQLPQPTIAVINGYAFGGGMELALACDFRIAVDHTLVGLTETSLAIIPGAGGTQRLPRLIGEAKALELILTARKLPSVEAYTYGLFTNVVAETKLEEAVQQFVSSILQNGPIALQQAKFAVKEGMKVDLQTGLQIERKAYELTIPTEDRVEALVAFGEKRKPQFKGR
ncbi:enoyl-CoA hydratase-related protein [Bacillus sp. CGMCC 1.16541]|uniref:enoyl-CoA hydratase-related protein n=1 Tax=Bacillus sp. CGMCC 1.16541 TaxID=2185143 RepID=UPI000D726C90|nr:enoyl-CoA hydratase-related protein [Bacillus sp. CGMCC 1.16541]